MGGEFQGPHCTGKTGKMGGGGSLSGKTEKYGEFGNFAKTQGIWFAQVVNSQNLKVKDILMFAAKKNNLSWISLPSQFFVCNSHKSHKLA